MRAFLAIPVENELLKILSNILFKQQEKYPQLNWTLAEKLHLTLHFFSDIKEQQAKEIIRISQAIAEQTKPFNLELTEIIFLPNKKFPHVLAYKVKANNELISLVNKLNQALEKIGFQRDHYNFLPHITIARIKKPFTNLSKIFLPNINENLQVTKINLIQSLTDKDKQHIYKTLQSLPLALG